MANKSKEQRFKEVHEEAMDNFNRIQTALRDERLQALQDRRFYSIAGAMWEGPLGLQFENKPKLEVNKIHLAVIRIVNEYRNNRITVNFIPKDGSENKELADTCTDLYRADEQDSVAEEAYDNAFEEAVGGGFGAWRLRNDYEDESDEDDDKQCIYIEPIFDADSSVFFDLDAKRQDKADAEHAFVLTSMTRQKFNEKYGTNEDDAPSSMPKVVHQRQFDWLTPDVAYIAEYYVKEKVVKNLVWYKGIGDSVTPRKFDQDELDEDPEMRKQLRETGFRKDRSKQVKITKVHKYLISGSRVLEDKGYIAGSNIPIVPMYGKRWFIDNVERCMGHVRLAKDPQRLKNMQLSKLAEISAMSTVEKPIVTPEQVAGHALMWAQDNVKNYPYLLMNAVKDAQGNPVTLGPTAYTRPPQIPPAMAALLQITEQDIQDILGNQEAGEQLNANLSGIAVELVQMKLDMQTFIYVSNMAKAIKRSGEIWLGMAKDVYVEQERKRKTVDQSGEVSSVTLYQHNVNKDGIPTLTNDLSKAKFDVTATPGPTSASKRAATVRALIGLLQITQDPTTIAIITAMIMMNMEGEGLDDVRDYFRKQLVQQGVVKPTQEEQQELQQAAQAKAQQPPDAQTQLLQASAELARADAVRKQADTVLIAARAQEAKANALHTLAEIDNDRRSVAFDNVKKLSHAALNHANVHDLAHQQALARQAAALDAQTVAGQQSVVPANPQNVDATSQ